MPILPKRASSSARSRRCSEVARRDSIFLSRTVFALAGPQGRGSRFRLRRKWAESLPGRGAFGSDSKPPSPEAKRARCPKGLGNEGKQLVYELLRGWLVEVLTFRS